MSLSETLSAPATVVRPKCDVSIALASLPKKDAAALREAIADEAFPATQIARAVRAEGYRMGDSTVRRHRRGDCTCP